MCKQFHVYPDGLERHRCFFGVDNGNSWHNLSNGSKFNGRAQESGNLVAAMSKSWEYSFHITVGRTPVPKRDALSTPSARKLHGLIIHMLKQHTKRIVSLTMFGLGYVCSAPSSTNPMIQGAISDLWILPTTHSSCWKGRDHARTDIRR